MDGISNLPDNFGPVAEHPALVDSTCTQRSGVPLPCATKPFLALVEIAAEADGQPPDTLLRALYRLSEQGRIVFALTRLTPEAVDIVLDDVVGELPLTIPGVLYIDAEDERAVAEAARDAGIVIAASVDFFARLNAEPLNPAPRPRAILLAHMPAPFVAILICEWSEANPANAQLH